ncbi:hypothetical protein N9195_03370, partial [bacterium]|nr:hypothetical protein [bacterium]
KADRLGRTHYSSDYKAEVLEAFASSSLSGPAFAKQCGIKYSTFASWVGKRKREASTSQQNDTVSAFVMAEVAGSPSVQTLEVVLPGGAVARVSTSSELILLAELLKALA